MHLAIEASGWLAAVLIVLAYGLTTVGRIAAGTALALNIAGALGLMINAAANSAWPSGALNLVWLGIAAAGWFRGFPGRGAASAIRLDAETGLTQSMRLLSPPLYERASRNRAEPKQPRSRDCPG